MSKTSPYNLEFAREYQKKIAFAEHLGFYIEHLEDGMARLSCALRPEMTNRWGIAHGGVILTLLDVTLCMAARTQHPDSGGVMTIDMSTSFTNAGKVKLLAEGRVLRPGRSVIFTEGEVRNTDGTLVAKGMATVRARDAEKKTAEK